MCAMASIGGVFSRLTLTLPFTRSDKNMPTFASFAAAVIAARIDMESLIRVNDGAGLAESRKIRANIIGEAIIRKAYLIVMKQKNFISPD